MSFFSFPAHVLKYLTIEKTRWLVLQKHVRQNSHCRRIIAENIKDVDG